MKKIVLSTLFVFLISNLSLMAQEKKKIHVKMIKDENGKVTEIDTVFEGSGDKDFYFFSDNSDDFKIDSILEKLEVLDKENMRFITLTDEFHSKDSLKNIKLIINADSEGDSVKVKKYVFMTRDGDKEILNSKNEMVWIMSDSAKNLEEIFLDKNSHAFVMTSGEGKKVKVVKKSECEAMTWTSDSDGKEKKIEIIISEDGDDSNIEVISLDDDDEFSDEDVKVFKQKMDDGTIIVKTEIIKDDKSDKKGKEVQKIKINKEKNSGIFNIEFEIEGDETLKLKVENEQGKTVYSKKIKKENGTYTAIIDLSKEPDGYYKLQIIQGDKILINEKVKK